MTFVKVETRKGMIHLDGYSRNKTLKGALSDLAREVAKIDEGEGRNISEYIDETAQMVIDGMANEPGNWYIEAEEVHCAARLKNPDSTEPEMEYAEGHWYLYIRFAAPEQEDKGQDVAGNESNQAENMVQEADADKDETAMKYEIKRYESDPFDNMCGSCHSGESRWESITAEELHQVHKEQLELNSHLSNFAIEEMKEDYPGWEPANPDFDAWIHQSIKEGYIRIAA